MPVMGLESCVSGPSCSYCVFALGSRNETFPAWNCVCNSKLVVLLFGCLCVHVRFYDCCCACLCVCLDVCLFVSLFVHFDVACLFLVSWASFWCLPGTSGHQLVLLFAPWGSIGDLGLHFATLGMHWFFLLHFGGPWNSILGSVCTPLGSILASLRSSGARPWTPVAILLEKNRNMTKQIQKGNPDGYFSCAIASFPEKMQNAFRLHRRERIKVRATHFLSWRMHFGVFLRSGAGTGPRG